MKSSVDVLYVVVVLLFVSQVVVLLVIVDVLLAVVVDLLVYHVVLYGTSKKTIKYELSSLFCRCIRPIGIAQCRTSYASCFTAF